MVSVEGLKKILTQNSLPAPTSKFQPDFFQKSVEENLYFEFFLSTGRVLVTPDFEMLPVGPLELMEEDEFHDILQSSREKLTLLKDYVIYQLSIYSALLETNSYYVCLNQYLVICRLVLLEQDDFDFEIKLYTISKEELPHNYKDKIYLGRDFISLSKMNREQLGLKYICSSIESQLQKLILRCKAFLPKKEQNEIQKEYFEEFSELLEYLQKEEQEIYKIFPNGSKPEKFPITKILDINRRFRELKHIIIDMIETARELETSLFDKNQPKAVRYATKFYKDLENYKNYIMHKVNGRISDFVNQIHI